MVSNNGLFQFLALMGTVGLSFFSIFLDLGLTDSEFSALELATVY